MLPNPFVDCFSRVVVIVSSMEDNMIGSTLPTDPGRLEDALATGVYLTAVGGIQVDVIGCVYTKRYVLINGDLLGCRGCFGSHSDTAHKGQLHTIQPQSANLGNSHDAVGAWRTGRHTRCAKKKSLLLCRIPKFTHHVCPLRLLSTYEGEQQTSLDYIIKPIS